MHLLDARGPTIAGSTVRLALYGILAFQPAARAREGPETTSITVRGHAVDLDGKPVAGATVNLVSTNGTDADLGTATTDKAGAYIFRDSKLPVRRQPSPPFSVFGTFQVYGTAPGLGFAWRGMRHYSGEPRPANWNPAGEDYSLFRGEPVTMDLAFSPAATLSGRAVDEAGKPVAGVEVVLGGCDFLDAVGKEGHFNYREFWSLYATPESLRTATTGPDGRFRIEALPGEVGFRVLVEHPRFARQTIYAATTGRSSRDFGYPKDQLAPGTERPAVQTGSIELILLATRRVSFHAVYDDTGKPAPNISISAGGYGDGPSAQGQTDAAGDLKLGVPPGKYTLVVLLVRKR